MTVIQGDTGRISQGTFKTFSFETRQREVALTPVTLPTVESVESYVSFTIQSTDLPIITPSPVSTKYSAFLAISGSNTSGTTANISYRILKNNSSVITSSATVINNNFWTHNHWRLYDVQVGDKLDVRLWTNQASVTLDYAMLQIYPEHTVLSPVGTIVTDLYYSPSNSTSMPSATGAGVRPILYSNIQNCYLTIANNAVLNNSNGTSVIQSSGGIIVYSTKSTSFGFYRSIIFPSAGGTAGASTSYSHLTSISFQRQYIPATITFREIFL